MSHKAEASFKSRPGVSEHLHSQSWIWNISVSEKMAAAVYKNGSNATTLLKNGAV